MMEKGLVHDTLFITHEGIMSRTWVFKDEAGVPIYKRVLRGLINTNETIVDAATNQVLASYKGGFIDSNGTITLYDLDGKETKTINVDYTSEGLTRLIHKFDYEGESFAWLQDTGIKNAICHISLPNDPQYQTATIAKFNDSGTLKLMKRWFTVKNTRELEILLVMTMCLFYNSIEPYKDSMSRMLVYQH